MARRDQLQLAKLALADYSDRELLIVVDETCQASDDPEYATSLEIAKTLGMTGEVPQRSVGSRLAYMRGVDLVEREPDRPGVARWKLTRLGRRVAFGAADPQTVERLQAARAEDAVLFARALAGSNGRMPDGARAVMRREWRRAQGLP